jgi:NitT/TauT family transport system ATP-binding protein
MRVILNDVAKTFSGDGNIQDALAPTSLKIESGEFICFIGPSGCGKSTLLRLIADQISPTQGTITIEGARPTEIRSQKLIAWMAQDPALLPWKTVLHNVQLPQQVNRGHHHPAPDPEVLLQLVGLERYADAYPHTLSGGMQQRVALARTLTIGAALWLMDEPFAALDELTRETLTEEVLELWREFEPTVLWVTHDIIEAARLADRIIVMTPSPGRIREIVPVCEAHPRDATEPAMIEIIRGVRHSLRVRPGLNR